MKYFKKNIFRLNFPADQYISYEDATKNLSLVLLNSHFSQGGIRPYVPAMIEVGGLQIKPKPDKLPEVVFSEVSMFLSEDFNISESSNLA